jgi:hypothetical protein
MSRVPLVVATAILVIAPCVAAAQGDRPCLREKRADEVVGALIGGGVGALIGNAVTGGHAGATVAGAASGAVAGAVVGSTATHCGENRYGYYDDAGHWVSYRSTAYGYIGPDGRWVNASGAGDGQGAAPEDTRGRELRIEAALERRMDEGALPPGEGRRALRALHDISATDAAYRSADGRLSPSQRRDIDARLDALTGGLGLAPGS